MASISHLFSGGFTPPPEVRPDPPEQQLIDAMRSAGIENPPDDIVMDGKIHRFDSGSRGRPGRDKPGWYVAFPDGVPAGAFGCWRAGIEQPWRADMGRKLSAAEEMAITRRIAEARSARDAESARIQQSVSSVVESIWSQAQAASADHPYLARKGIEPHGARVTGDGRLVLPLYSADGELFSLQYIAHDGSKLYHASGKTAACSWMVGDMDRAGVIYVAEGFATAATVHEVTGAPCMVAYSASNLPHVTGQAKEITGGTWDVIVVADNDASGTGQKYADQASAKHGARVVMPPIEGMDVNDYLAAGGDVLSLLVPPPEPDWLIHADDFSRQPAPIAWMIKHWVQDKALIMVHGPSGGGKTFVVLDWCLRVASGIDDWLGSKVRHGAVVYLAGEGHHGLRGRIAAWKHHHGIKKLDMWLSQHGCDLNTAEGYQKAASHIRSLPVKPRVIVVDTLHRFLAGDENSAKDAKTMLDACAMLMAEFGCAVILVHHTGVAEEAQHRARGSSAWRGALDIEVSIVPAKDNAPMQIVQRKNKDAELTDPIFVELLQVVIPDWFDEDEQPVTSAVVVASGQAAPVPKMSKGLRNHLETFESAWRLSGSEDIDGLPYLTESAAKRYLIDEANVIDSTAKRYIDDNRKDRFIGSLINNKIIERANKNGWVVIDAGHASAMMLSRSVEK